MFVNVDRLFKIENRLLKFSVVIIDMLKDGAVSQILYLGHSICFMWLQQLKYANKF